MATPRPHRVTKTRSDTLLVNEAIVKKWAPPPFQRPLTINAAVTALSEEIKADGGVIPGVITLGELGGTTYLLDGQHRVHAFLLSGLPEGYADVRVHGFDDMGQMGDEFVNLNGRLVTLRPDDILRGLEGSTPPLRSLRERLKFVGYGQVRRGTSSTTVSMSALLRSWTASRSATPTNRTGSAATLGRTLTQADADELVTVSLIFDRAWGNDIEYARLWNNLNLSLCMWLYRKIVLDKTPRHSKGLRRWTKGGTRAVHINGELFAKAMMTLSGDSLYLDWLQGRQLNDKNRSPAFAKIKRAVQRRLFEETGKQPMLPQPEWSSR